MKKSILLCAVAAVSMSTMSGSAFAYDGFNDPGALALSAQTTNGTMLLVGADMRTMNALFANTDRLETGIYVIAIPADADQNPTIMARLSEGSGISADNGALASATVLSNAIRVAVAAGGHNVPTLGITASDSAVIKFENTIQLNSSVAMSGLSSSVDSGIVSGGVAILAGIISGSDLDTRLSVENSSSGMNVTNVSSLSGGHNVPSLGITASASVQAIDSNATALT